ncbi:MAG: hypothetical protein ACREM2_11265 [Vulcanimicrobiaceae bacterium]
MKIQRNLAVRSAAAALATLLSAVLPMAVPAQSAGAAPSYAQPSYGTAEDVIRGRIVAFDGRYRMQVRDQRGFVDRVELHQGTIINPTGLTLQPGMAVTVRGVNRGSVLDANEIDTPYRTWYAYPGPYPYAYPAYRYRYPGYAYGYPGYLGYPYGYGPSFGIGFGFGGYGYRSRWCCDRDDRGRGGDWHRDRR